MTTTTVFGGTTDDVIRSSNATYNTARNGSSLTLEGVTDPTSSVGQATSYTLREMFLEFDTSAIPDTDAVSAVVLSMWLSSDQSTTDFVLQARAYDWGASVTTADWQDPTELAADTLLATLDTNGIGAGGAYKAFTADAAFLTAVNKTGATRLVLVSDRQVAGTTPTTDERLTLTLADQAGTTNDPKLVVTHAAPSTGNPTVMLI